MSQINEHNNVILINEHNDGILLCTSWEWRQNTGMSNPCWMSNTAPGEFAVPGDPVPSQVTFPGGLGQINVSSLAWHMALETLLWHLMGCGQQNTQAGILDGTQEASPTPPPPLPPPLAPLSSSKVSLPAKPDSAT